MPKVVFILGAHRSGTSALAGALRFCGFRHSPLLTSATSGTSNGAWEPAPVVHLNERILRVAGAGWDRIPLWLDFASLAPRPFGEWCAGTFQAAAAEAWEEAFGGVDGDLVCKDPRLSLTLPLWLQTATAKGFETDVLLAHRAPDKIAASLARRNALTFGDSLELILDYWSGMMTNAPKSARVACYETLVSAPEEALERLGFAPGSPIARRDLIEFVRDNTTRWPSGVIPKAVLPRSISILDGALANAHGACLLKTAMPYLAAIERTREEHKRYDERVYYLPSTAPVKTFAVQTKRRRKVVLHCHIFKNAGSSVDAVLEDNFGERWTEEEFPTRPQVSNADLTNAFIRIHDDLEAVSTHTGDWWFGHSDPELTVLPVIFLRHPLLRIRSAYSFEKKQDATTVGAKLAKEWDFPGYVRARLDRPNDFAFRDFQARRLAAFREHITTDLRSTAMRAMEAAPFVGLVEDFAGSAKRLEDYLKPHFEDFQAYEARQNVTDTSGASQEEKLDKLTAELGDELYEELCLANAIDLEIYESATARWSAERPIGQVVGAK